MDADLQKQYINAVYAISFNGEEIRFKVGAISQKIDALLNDRRAETFAFLTAYNPFSKILSDKENQSRQSKLIKLLQAENFQFFEGYGTNETESWEREQSLFVLNISEQRALNIARQFEQHAILFGEKNKSIKLVWCDQKVSG